MSPSLPSPCDGELTGRQSLVNASNRAAAVVAVASRLAHDRLLAVTHAAAAVAVATRLVHDRLPGVS